MGGGPRAVITDIGMLAPHPESEELQLVALYAGTSADEARAAIGWPLRIADQLDTIAVPSAHELNTLRALNARTLEAHARPVHIPLPAEGLP
jgi:glutaconate CoA-transferase subunit B